MALSNRDRALDSMKLLLQAVSAGEQARELEREAIFRRTFLTEGLRRLFGNALRRLTDSATLHALSQMRECLQPPQADS